MRPVVLSALSLHLFTMLMSVLSWCFFTTECFLLTNTLLSIIGVIYCNTAHSCLMMNWNLIIYVCAKPLCLYVAGFFGFKFDVVRLVWAQISPGKDEEKISFWFHHHKHGWKTSGRLVKHIQWFHLNECWNTVLNSGLWQWRLHPVVLARTRLENVLTSHQKCEWCQI